MHVSEEDFSVGFSAYSEPRTAQQVRSEKHGDVVE